MLSIVDSNGKHHVSTICNSHGVSFNHCGHARHGLPIWLEFQ